jgi:signal transduction histidine kinase
MTESRWADSQLIGTRTRSVWQWQLIFTFSVVVIGVVVGVLDITLLTDSAFLGGVILIIATSTASLVTPWARYPKHTVVILPLIDIIGIGLLAMAEQTLGYLWVFPIAWVATYFSIIEVVSALALITAMEVLDPSHAGFPPAVIVEVLIVVLALAFLGITILVGTRRTRAFRHLTRRQATRLDGTLRRVQAAETRVNALFDSISVALARINHSGEVVAANAAYRELYVLDPGDFRLVAGGAVEYSDYRGTALPPAETSVARAARGETVERERLWLFDRNGAWRAFEMSIRPTEPNSLGELTSIIELDDLTAVAEEQRTQPSVARVISHELRNPLTAVLGHVDLLAETDGLTRAQREHLAVIESAGERMLHLIQGFLSQQREAETTERTFDLARVVADSVAAFLPAASASALTIAPRIDGPLPLRGDEFRLRQVIDNLLSNAIKYSERGTVRISARARDDVIEIVVADEGIGMTPDDAAQVFTPYFRAQTVEENGISGTGLGMGISREIVDDHGGSIAIDSRLGSGTTFTIELPAADTSTEGER